MALIRFAIQNPVKVAVSVILLVMFGLISYASIPVQLTPNVIEPEITVTTRWPGASAQEVEREIVEEQEEQLKSVEGLREFESESRDSRARITMKFEVGTDLGVAQAKVRDKLNQVPEYPEDAKEPTITTVNPNSNAIAWLMLLPQLPTPQELTVFVRVHSHLKDLLSPMIEGRQTIELSVLSKWAREHPELMTLVSGKNDPSKMRKFAEEFIEARLERVEGIANANVLGGREEEFRVIVDPVRLAAYRLTVGDLRRALASQNRNTSGGDIQEGKFRNVVRTLGQFDSPDKVADTIITHRDGTPIRVRDVATVRLDHKKPDGIVRQKGVASLAINAQQYPGSNLLEVMGPPLEDLDIDRDGELTQLDLAQAKRQYGDSLRIAVAELNIGVLKQKGLRLQQVYDQTDYLKSATELVGDTILLGGSLAVGVLLLFLRSFRSVLIVGMSIPISIIATFLFVRGFGRSINVISLAGMAFAVGMVVDNAIVVLENIYRHYQRSHDPEKAALEGSTEVWGAVLASTLTTLAVFVPVIFVRGQAGQLFRDIAIAISCAVGLSLIVSITVIPTAARWMLKRGTPFRLGERSRATRRFSLTRFGNALVDWFSNGIGALIGMRGGILLRVAIVTGFMVVSIGGAYVLMPKTEYLPDGNRNLVIAVVMPPSGYNLDQMIRLGDIIEPEIARHWEVEPGSPEEAALDGPRIDNFFFVARGRSLFMGARSVDPLRAGELVPVLKNAALKVPGTFAIAAQASLFDRAISGGRTIDIEITGPDLETLVEEAQKIFGMCQEEFPFEDGHQVQPIPGLELTSPELHVVPKLEKAAELGITATDLGYSVNALVDGAYAGDYWHEGRKIDLVIFGAEQFAQHTQDLESLPISTPSGKLVSLSSVADIKLASGPDQVNHIERLRAITLRLKPAPTVPLEKAMEIVNERIREPLMATRVFEGGLYQIRLAGTADKLELTRLDLQWNLVLALVITYLLMAALFESFLFPVVIMTSVVLALVGGFGGLAALNLFMPTDAPQPLDMLTMLGFVILIGTVVNSAILIVHQALNNIRSAGMSEQPAIVESVRTRIRPIFMSTMTTVLAMLPLVLPVPSFTPNGVAWVSGAGSELYRGLGSVVLGGLITSTVFTLILVPIGFSIAWDVKSMFRRLLGFETRRNAEFEESAGAMPANAPLAPSAAESERENDSENDIPEKVPAPAVTGEGHGH